jgi:hypothetical protein
VINSGIVRAGVILVASLLVAGCGGGSSSSDPSDYKVDILNGWSQITKEKRVGGYTENAWRDPVSPIIAIDTRPADETGSPMANADLAKIQTYQLPGYRERGVKRIKLGRRPAVQWGFDTANERSGIDFFFEECGISFIVRGTMGTVAFEAFEDSFREMAETIKAGCDE